MKIGKIVFLTTITIIICLPHFLNKKLVKSKSVCDEILKRSNNIPVKTFNGSPAKVNFSKFPGAKLFYTRITEAAADGPNFAGHFTFADWGCGMLCMQYAIIDSITGDIVVYQDNPVELVTDTAHDINSRLLVFNPKDSFRYLEGRTLEDIFKNDEYEASWSREYYELVEDETDNSPWLNKLCTENLLDGLYKF